jgi:hypothetical protein
MTFTRARELKLVVMIMAFICFGGTKTFDVSASTITSVKPERSVATIDHHTKRRLQDASSSPSLAPSVAPTFGIQKVISPLLVMDIEGLSIDDMEGSRARDHWRTQTSQYIQSFWESNAQQEDFLPESIGVFVEYKDPISGEQDEFVGIRVGYTLEVEVRAPSNSNISIPRSVLSFPVTPAYVDSLKRNDPTTLQVFDKISNVINLGVFQETVTPYPTVSPSAHPSSLPPTLDQLHNAKSNAMNVATNFLITLIVVLGLLTLVVMWKNLPKEGKMCKNGQRYSRGEHDDVLDQTMFPVVLNGSDDGPNIS